MQYDALVPHITIDQPMVLIPAAEYKLLLREAGFSPTPKLDREIAQARQRFKKGRIVSWQSIKHELRKIQH